MNEIKKKSLKKSLGYGLLCICVGIVILYFMIKDNSNYVSFGSLLPEEINNQNVELTIYDAYGVALEEYEYNKKTKVERTTDLYYVILTGDLDSEDCRYMCLKIPTKYQDKLDEIVDLTYNNQLATEPFHGFGSINRLDNDKYAYFEEFFLDAGWTSEEIKESTIPYYISYKGESAIPSSVYVVGAIGVILIAIGLFLIINAITGGFLKKLKKDIAAAGISEDQFLEDFNYAEKITKRDSIRLGRYCIYTGMNSLCPRAIKTENVLWAYQKVTKHRRNFITVRKTYEICVYDVNRSMESSEVKNEAEALAILEKMAEKYPWSIIGYSEELNKLFNNNFEQFKSLRYNERNNDIAI